MVPCLALLVLVPCLALPCFVVQQVDHFDKVWLNQRAVDEYSLQIFFRARVTCCYYLLRTGNPSLAASLFVLSLSMSCLCTVTRLVLSCLVLLIISWFVRLSCLVVVLYCLVLCCHWCCVLFCVDLSCVIFSRLVLCWCCIVLCRVVIVLRLSCGCLVLCCLLSCVVFCLASPRCLVSSRLAFWCVVLCYVVCYVVMCCCLVLYSFVLSCLVLSFFFFVFVVATPPSPLLFTPLILTLTLALTLTFKTRYALMASQSALAIISPELDKDLRTKYALSHRQQRHFEKQTKTKT